MPWQIGSKISVSPRSGIRSPNESALEIAHRAADGDARGAELPDEIGLARKAVAVFPAAAQDLVFEGAIDLPMFRRFGGFRPAHDKMI
jgi:hypothetical protein